MKKEFKIIIFLLVIIISHIFYYNSDSHLSKYHWKRCDGDDKLHDFLIYDRPYRVCLFRIYYKNEFIGYCFCLSTRLWIYYKNGQYAGCWGEYSGK